MVPPPADEIDRRTAVPNRTARTLAVVAIVVAGLCGGLIGYAFTDLQCDDDCTLWAGLTGLLGAVAAAVGVAVVAVLTLRAMDEWHSIQDEPADPRDQAATDS